MNLVIFESNMVGRLKLQLVKEPDNEYDKEAIMAKVPGIGKVGYVANSVKTVCIEKRLSCGKSNVSVG